MLKYNPKIFKNFNNDEGFTLLEVIMAVSILTIGLLGVASLQVTAMKGNSMSMTYSESTEKVQDTVEKLLNREFTDPLLSDTDDDVTGGLNDTEGLADHSTPGPIYDVYWNVADDQVWTGAGWRTVNNIKTIRVIVKWRERGAPKDYSFDLLRNRI